MKNTIALTVVAVFAACFGYLFAKGPPVIEYLFGSPTITVINLSGKVIAPVTISLGKAHATVQEMKSDQSVTVSIRGKLSEKSTHIAWTDAGGTHTAVADDYVENYGFCHSTVVLREDRTLVAVRELK